MAVATKKIGREEMVRELFLTLAPKWDVHDRVTARHLARQCLEAIDGFYEELDKSFAAKKPEKPS
jgi:hypothetical protein